MSDKKRESVCAGVKLRGAEKIRKISVREISAEEGDANDALLRKPDWIRVRLPGSPEVSRIKNLLREKKLSTVCEEASCPNLGECFHHGTATFLIMGDICTRRCPFCDVASGRPAPLDDAEPSQLAEAIDAMNLRYVVITSVDRDDLPDGGAGHFRRCVTATRLLNPSTEIEVLVPDFKGKVERALDVLTQSPPDVFNHNLETVPDLYRRVRPGANYVESLALLAKHKERLPDVPTKSGLMLGLGEQIRDVEKVMLDLRDHRVDMLTLGQYLQPSKHHLPVARYVHPDEFDRLAELARELGFLHVASAPLVRSSYHADKQAKGEF